MAKDKLNLMPVPPDGGTWTFIMRFGKTYAGQLLQRYDDAVIFQPLDGVVAAVFIKDIESMWQGLATPESLTKVRDEE